MPVAMPDKLTAQQKRDAGMALNLTELAQVSGWGISSLRAMALPLVCGKIDWPGFQRFLRKTQDALIPSELGHPPWPSTAVIGSDLRKVADKFRAPRSKNGRKAASPCLAGSPPHNNE